jgi:bifunctional DNA-binding transcriptional regulator/antitoxin component of YhaV-PrlF toxin-antitoxin module
MTKSVEVSVDDLGRIVIPTALKDHLGLVPGMTLVVEGAADTELCLRVQPEAELVEKDGVLIVRAEATEDLSDIVRRTRDQRIRDLLWQSGR